MELNLSLTNVTKVYDKKAVLQGCTQAFGKGVTVIMGPNGCGKSTLLKMCALLETPTSGKISYYYVKGKPLADDLKLRRKVTLVMPGGGIFDTSVWNNATYGMRVRHAKRRETNRRTKELLQAVGLYDKRKQNALSISSGEAQRLAMVRALVFEPEVLLLDEPTVNVDEQNRVIIENIILKLRNSPVSPTILLATHDRAQAERLGNRILTIKKGTFASSWTAPTAGMDGEPDYGGKSKEDPGAGGFFIDRKFFS